jgi:hypothetical protein
MLASIPLRTRNAMSCSLAGHLHIEPADGQVFPGNESIGLTNGAIFSPDLPRQEQLDIHL